MKKGETVHWKWGRSTAGGKVVQKFTEPVSKTIKGTEIKRNASKEAPAYLIRQEDGSEVLKLASELIRSKAK